MTNEKITVTQEALLNAKKGNNELLYKQTVGFLNKRANQLLPYLKEIDHDITFNDLVNDGFIGIIKSLEKYDENKGNFLTYARHYIDFKMYYERLNESKKMRFSDVENFDEVEDNHQEPQEDLSRFLNGLPERNQKIIKMKHENKMTFEQIGQSLGLSGMRIHQLYSKSLESIKPKITEYYDRKYMYQNMINIL